MSEDKRELDVDSTHQLQDARLCQGSNEAAMAQVTHIDSKLSVAWDFLSRTRDIYVNSCSFFL